MVVQIFAVFDSKTKAFMQPFFSLAIGSGIRAFVDAVNDASTPFFKHPQDFSLFHIGSFDDQVPRLVALDAPLNLGLAASFKEAVSDPAQLTLTPGGAK